MIYKYVYFNIQNNPKFNDFKMDNFENKYIQIPDDIDFLLDLCQDLIKLLRKNNPNKDLPIDRKQIAKLNSIARRIH